MKKKVKNLAFYIRITHLILISRDICATVSTLILPKQGLQHQW